MFGAIQLNMALDYPSGQGRMAAEQFQVILENDCQKIFKLVGRPTLSEFFGSLSKPDFLTYTELFIEIFCSKISHSQVIRMRAQHYATFGTYDF